MILGIVWSRKNGGKRSKLAEIRRFVVFLEIGASEKEKKNLGILANTPDSIYKHPVFYVFFR
jgi:hypothetical protein